MGILFLPARQGGCSSLLFCSAVRPSPEELRIWLQPWHRHPCHPLRRCCPCCCRPRCPCLCCSCHPPQCPGCCLPCHRRCLRCPCHLCRHRCPRLRHPRHHWCQHPLWLRCLRPLPCRLCWCRPHCQEGG